MVYDSMFCHVMLCFMMSCHVCDVLFCEAMTCYVMSCHVMLCHVTLCYVMLCYVMLYYVVLWHGRIYMIWYVSFKQALSMLCLVKNTALNFERLFEETRSRDKPPGYPGFGSTQVHKCQEQE